MAIAGVYEELFAHSSLLQLSLVASALLYVSWRLWTFTIHAALHPDHPKQVPYLIPFLGHALTFFRDSNKACRDARRSMGDTQDPLGLVIAGHQFYIINSPEDVTTFYANKKSLSFDEYVVDVLTSMGCSSDGVDKMTKIQPHLKKSLVAVGEDFYRAQFLPGPRFNTFWPEVYRRIEVSLNHDSISLDNPLSLWQLCRSVLLGPTLASIFGDAVLKTDPTIIDAMVEFDDLSWKINYKVPRPFSNDCHAARSKMIEFFKTYRRLPNEHKRDASWFVRSLDEEMVQAGLSDHDIAVFSVSVSWTALSNAFKACFWLVAYIVHDLELFTAIQKEVRSADTSSLHDTEAQLESSYPILISVYNEILRFNGSSVSIRTAVEPTKLGRFIIPTGSRIILPTRQLHLNERAFAEPHHFRPDRFTNPKIAKGPGFRPFGGGVSYCPGRYLARRELIVFVALLFNRFDVRLASNKQRFPRLDEVHPSVGMLTPVVGDDVTLSLQSRSTSVP